MRTVTTEDLNTLTNADLTLVNSLGPEAFENTAIPGAVNIPLESDDFVARVEAEAGGKHKPIVVYSASEQCDSSERAARKLEGVGFTSVYRYTGGAVAWRQEADEAPLAKHC